MTEAGFWSRLRRLPAFVPTLIHVAKLLSNRGRPLAPTGYDFDSLDNRDPAAVAEMLAQVADPLADYLQAEVRGLPHTRHGPSLFVGNHNAGALAPEIFLFGRALYRAYGLAAVPYGLAHELVGRFPPLSRALIPIGAVRASHANAARLYERGASILVYPGGDEDALRSSTRRDQIVFGARRGYMRLALRHGVPIVPVVTAGAHDVFRVLYEGQHIARWLKLDRLLRMKMFPVMLSVPWGLTIGFPLPFVPMPTRVLIEIMEPIRFARSGQAAADDAPFVESCHQVVLAQMQACLTRLARELRGQA